MQPASVGLVWHGVCTVITCPSSVAELASHGTCGHAYDWVVDAEVNTGRSNQLDLCAVRLHCTAPVCTPRPPKPFVSRCCADSRDKGAPAWMDAAAIVDATQARAGTWGRHGWHLRRQLAAAAAPPASVLSAVAVRRSASESQCSSPRPGGGVWWLCAHLSELTFPSCLGAVQALVSWWRTLNAALVTVAR